MSLTIAQRLGDSRFQLNYWISYWANTFPVGPTLQISILMKSSGDVLISNHTRFHLLKINRICQSWKLDIYVCTDCITLTFRITYQFSVLQYSMDDNSLWRICSDTSTMGLCIYWCLSNNPSILYVFHWPRLKRLVLVKTNRFLTI